MNVARMLCLLTGSPREPEQGGSCLQQVDCRWHVSMLFVMVIA